MDQIRQREGLHHSVWHQTVKPVVKGMLAASTLTAGIMVGADMYWMLPNHPLSNLSDWRVTGRAILNSQANSPEGRMTVLVLGGALLFAFIEYARNITKAFKHAPTLPSTNPKRGFAIRIATVAAGAIFAPLANILHQAVLGKRPETDLLIGFLVSAMGAGFASTLYEQNVERIRKAEKRLGGAAIRGRELMPLAAAIGGLALGVLFNQPKNFVAYLVLGGLPALTPIAVLLRNKMPFAPLTIMRNVFEKAVLGAGLGFTLHKVETVLSIAAAVLKSGAPASSGLVGGIVGIGSGCLAASILSPLTKTNARINLKAVSLISGLAGIVIGSLSALQKVDSLIGIATMIGVGAVAGIGVQAAVVS